MDRAAVAAALEAWEAGHSIIVAALNVELAKHDLRIEAEPPRSGVTWQDILRRLNNALLAIRPSTPDLPLDSQLSPWTLGYANGTNNRPVMVKLVGDPDKMIRLVVETLKSSRQDWQPDYWNACIVDAVNDNAASWRNWFQRLGSEEAPAQSPSPPSVHPVDDEHEPPQASHSKLLSFDEILALSTAARDIATYAGQLIKWGHGLIELPESPSFLIETVRSVYEGHRRQPADVPEFTAAMRGSDIESMADVHGKSYHDLAWKIAERILREVIGAVIGTQMLGVGWNPVTGLTRAPLPSYTGIVGWQGRLRQELQKLPPFDEERLNVLVEREADLVRHALGERGSQGTESATSQPISHVGDRNKISSDNVSLRQAVSDCFEHAAGVIRWLCALGEVANERDEGPPSPEWTARFTAWSRNLLQELETLDAVYVRVIDLLTRVAAQIGGLNVYVCGRSGPNVIDTIRQLGHEVASAIGCSAQVSAGLAPDLSEANWQHICKTLCTLDAASLERAKASSQQLTILARGALDHAVGTVFIQPRAGLPGEVGSGEIPASAQPGNTPTAEGPLTGRKPHLPKMPPKKAWQAWQILKMGISNQTEIAAKMTKNGSPATQGEVSRWHKQVREFVGAGGKELSAQEVGAMPDQAVTWDSATLDLGQRVPGEKHRPEHQRPGYESGSDE